MYTGKKIFLIKPISELSGFFPVSIGRICSAYGILGWLRIISFTDQHDKIMSYQPWFVRLFSHWYRLYLEKWKRHSSNCYFIVKIKDICDRDMAQMLNNHKIFIDSGQLPGLDFGEYYWKDLIGCRVVEISGYVFGIVIDLIETGANDVLVVKNNMDSCCSVFLIPFIDTVIKNIDLLSHVINVNWDPQF